MNDLSLTELILVGVVSFIWLLYVPFCICYWYAFSILHKRSRFNRKLATFLKVRHASLIHCITASCFLTMIIEIPYVVLVDFVQLIPNWPHSKDPENDLIFELLHAMLFYVLVFFMFVKFYLLYYNMKLTLAKTNLAWQMKINAHVTDWYIENTERWGNPVWLTKMSIIPYLIVISFVVINDWLLGKCIQSIFCVFLFYFCLFFLFKIECRGLCCSCLETQKTSKLTCIS